MKPEDLVKKYGTQRAVAKKFGFTPAAVSQWVKKGKIPMRTQALLRSLSGSLGK